MLCLILYGETKWGGAAVENAAKIGAFVVCALCAFVLLSCGGGGGGGGGGVAAASSSGPWGGKTTITIPFTKGASRAGFSEGFLRLPWKSITFTVTQTANGVSEVVFEETIEAEKNITVEVLTGSKIEATAVITMNDGTSERTATGVIERVEPGKNTLTLHVPYTYTLQYGAGGPIETGEYNSREGLNLPSYYDTPDNTRIVTEFRDNVSNKTYLPGIHHDITGDIELKAEISPMNVYQDDGKYYIGCDPGTLPATITIPAKVGDKTIYGIGDGYFKERTDIQTVIIEDGIQSIGDNAFEDCDNLQSVTIPDSVTSIGEYAFQSTGITSLKLPRNLTTLGQSAFEDCSSLTGTVTIPGGVETIPLYTFSATGITGLVIEEGVKTIGNQAFNAARSLASISLPDGLETIEGYALATGAYESITIPNSVTSIGNGIFNACPNLREVRMPMRAEASGRLSLSGIFDTCSSVRDIYFTTSTPPTTVVVTGNFPVANITIHYPSPAGGDLDAWVDAFSGYSFKNVVPYIP